MCSTNRCVSDSSSRWKRERRTPSLSEVGSEPGWNSRHVGGLQLEQQRGKRWEREVGVGSAAHVVSVHGAVPLPRLSNISHQELLKSNVISIQHSWLLTQRWEQTPCLGINLPSCIPGNTARPLWSQSRCCLQ